MINKIINNRYAIKRKIKSGGFGAVYEVCEKNNPKKQYALKLMPKQHRRYSDSEHAMYCEIQNHKYTHGFVKNYEYSVFEEKTYLLLELLGRDLEDIMRSQKKGKLSVKSTFMIGLQLVDRLEAFHKIGYLHRDIKPDNLVVGLHERSRIIYLIDFGLARKRETQKHASQKGKAVGTLAFMSCNAHQDKEEHSADDLESLLYTMLYLMHGTLPWMKVQVRQQADLHKVLLLKQSLSKSSFKGTAIPQELFLALGYLRGLKKGQTPDYLHIKFLLLQGLKHIGAENDFQFQWCESKEQSPRKQENSLKRQERMIEDNQKFVEREIYEVYKFFGEERPTLPTQRKPKQQQNQKQLQAIQPQKHIKGEKMRPKSMANQRARIEDKLWEKINMMQNFQPKIVINKTAKHKI